MADKKTKKTGYDKYVDWKVFFIPVVLFFLVLFLPTPYGMKDVGTEFTVAPKRVVDFCTQKLFDKSSVDAEQWQLITARIMNRTCRWGLCRKKIYEPGLEVV